MLQFFNDPTAQLNPAPYLPMAAGDATDFAIIMSAISGAAGVLTPCLVAPQGSPNNTVAVCSPGDLVGIAGVSVAVSAVSAQTVPANASGQFRRDLVTVDATGAVHYNQGTPAAQPCVPSVPAGQVALAVIEVPSGFTSVNSSASNDGQAKISPRQVSLASFGWPGDIKPVGAIALQSGWCPMDGRALSRSTYSGLFDSLTAQMTGNTHTTATVDGLASTTQLQVGWYVSGPGIPAGATVLTVGANSVTISPAATATASGVALVFGPNALGDGSTTFNVPDVRGQTLVGSGTGSYGGATARIQGQNLGEEAHQLSTAELASHTHAPTDPGHGHSSVDSGHGHGSHGHTDPGHSHGFSYRDMASAGGNVSITNSPVNYTGNNIDSGGVTNAANTGLQSSTVPSGTASITTASHLTGITIVSTGSSNSHNTMQPSEVVLYAIKL